MFVSRQGHSSPGEDNVDEHDDTAFESHVSAPDECDNVDRSVVLYWLNPGSRDWGSNRGGLDPDPPCAPLLRRGSPGVG